MEQKPEFYAISDLKRLDRNRSWLFQSVLLLKRVTRKTAKNGSDFLSVELGDKTGQIQIVCFGDSPTFSFFSQAEIGLPVKIEGSTEYYQDRLSPRISSVAPLREGELKEGEWLDRLIASSAEDAEALWEELKGHIEEITHESLKRTVKFVFAPAHRKEKFKTVAAAISMHHAYRGGLLEHTVHLCRAGKALLPNYPEVNADLAMSGIILHDVGKTIEYAGNLVTTRSRKGILQGHVVLGYRLVRKASLQAKLEPSLRERLEHIILSHQGEIEWGAAVMAATPEAVFVSMLDNLDAKMGMVQNALRSAVPEEEFSDYLPGLKTPLLTKGNFVLDPPGAEPEIREG